MSDPKEEKNKQCGKEVEIKWKMDSIVMAHAHRLREAAKQLGEVGQHCLREEIKKLNQVSAYFEDICRWMEPLVPCDLMPYDGGVCLGFEQKGRCIEVLIVPGKRITLRYWGRGPGWHHVECANAYEAADEIQYKLKRP